MNHRWKKPRVLGFIRVRVSRRNQMYKLVDSGRLTVTRTLETRELEWKLLRVPYSEIMALVIG